MKVAITGASGFIGRRLLKNFQNAGYDQSVLSRNAGTNLPAGVRGFGWDPMKGPPPEDSLRDRDVVVQIVVEAGFYGWTHDRIALKLNNQRQALNQGCIRNHVDFEQGG